MSSVEAKIERAKQHFNQVQGAIDVWKSERHFEGFYERSEDGRTHYLKAKLTGSMPPVEEWALLIGDGITNLRDSLDHLIYQASNPDLNNPAHPKAAFVIARKSTSFRNEAKEKLAGISEATRAVIETLQPHNRPHRFVAPSLLKVINDFAVTNKHMLLLPVFAMPSKFKAAIVTEAPVTGRVTILRANIEDGSVIFAYETERPESGVSFRVEEIDLDIGLVHESPSTVPAHISGRSPTRLLIPALIQEVETVIDAIRRSF